MFLHHFISLDLLFKSQVCVVSHRAGLKRFNGPKKPWKLQSIVAMNLRWPQSHKNYKSFKATGLTVSQWSNRFWVSYYFKTLKNSAKSWQMWRCRRQSSPSVHHSTKYSFMTRQKLIFYLFIYFGKCFHMLSKWFVGPNVTRKQLWF